MRFLEILSQKRRETCEVGRRHGGTAHLVVAAGNRRGYLAAVGGDFGLNLQVGRGTPARIVVHEGACLVVLAERYRARSAPGRARARKKLSGIDGDGDCGDSVLQILERHPYHARNVVVYDYGIGAHRLGRLNLILEGGDAAPYDCDYLVVAFLVGELSLYSRGIVACRARAGYDDVFEGNGTGRISQHVFEEVICVGVLVARFFVVDCAAVALIRICEEVGCALTVDAGNRKRCRIGRGRAYRARVGVACKVGAVDRTVARGEVVACRNYEAYALISYGVVYGVERVAFVILFGKAERGRAEARLGAERHVDDVDAQLYAVVESGDYVLALRAADVVGI